MSEVLAPTITHLNAPFWAAGEDNRLVLPVCVDTGRAFWPPSPISPFVTGGAVEWRAADDVGTVSGVVVYRRVFQKAFEPLSPYGVGLIELDAGPRLLAHVSRPDDVDAPRAGDRARLRFVRHLDGGPVVPTLFRLN